VNEVIFPDIELVKISKYPYKLNYKLFIGFHKNNKIDIEYNFEK